MHISFRKCPTVNNHTLGMLDKHGNQLITLFNIISSKIANPIYCHTRIGKRCSLAFLIPAIRSNSALCNRRPIAVASQNRTSPQHHSHCSQCARILFLLAQKNRVIVYRCSLCRYWQQHDHHDYAEEKAQ